MTTWVMPQQNRKTSAKVGRRTISITLVDDRDFNTSIADRALEIRAWIDGLSCFALRVLEQVDDGRNAAIRATDDENTVRVRKCEVAQSVCYIWESHLEKICLI
jgi:hypothetical protein